jgi:hypothetical protein
MQRVIEWYYYYFIANTFFCTMFEERNRGDNSSGVWDWAIELGPYCRHYDVEGVDGPVIKNYAPVLNETPAGMWLLPVTQGAFSLS